MMQDFSFESFPIDRACADQIALAPYVITGKFCLFYRIETTAFGEVRSWSLMDLETAQTERVPLRPSHCLSPALFTSSSGQFFYYQDYYPERALYQYDPVQKKARRLYFLSQSLGAFQADGDWIAFTTEPDIGVLDQPEEFHLFNWKTGAYQKQTSAHVYPGRLPAQRHQNWYFKQEKLFFVCKNPCWEDRKGENLQGKLACYDTRLKEIVALTALPPKLSVRQMLLKKGDLWILGTEGSEFILYRIPMRENLEDTNVQEMLRIRHESYDQLIDIQLREQGVFWLKKEIHSLLESASALWWYSLAKREPSLMIRLSDFRALDIHFQPVGKYLYYQDELWKNPYCTPLDAPLTKEKVEVELPE